MARFPTVADLAQAQEDEVLSLWSGLGYYSRARNMHKASKMVFEAGEFPVDEEGFRALPGVGEYMAAAIASIALGHDVATVDGNIARVMSRLHADASPRKTMWKHARTHLPAGRAGDYNQALMDLGSRICIPKNPRCSLCPVDVDCRALSTDTVALYPPPKVKKKVPETHMACIAVGEGERFWLGRRPSKGLWGGLWELPTLESSTAPTATQAEQWFGVPASGIGVIRHVLTHRIIWMSVFGADVTGPYGPLHYEEFKLVNRQQIQVLGVSRLTEKTMAMAQDWRAMRS
jgi:A/G-specific adenine glycosylase